MLNYEKIVNEHRDGVWKSICRLIPNEADAHDCFQDTFIDFLKYTRKHHVANPRGLLLRIATSRAIDMIRCYSKKDKKLTQYNDEFINKKTVTTPCNAEKYEFAEILTKALGRLKGIEAEVFCLRHLDDLSYEEIAMALKIRTNHVGVVLHRAKNKLNEMLSKDLGV